MSKYDAPDLPLEPPEEKPIGYCCACKDEVYGEALVLPDGRLLCAECVKVLADGSMQQLALMVGCEYTNREVLPYGD